jgi:hypothetical protein
MHTYIHKYSPSISSTLNPLPDPHLTSHSTHHRPTSSPNIDKSSLSHPKGHIKRKISPLGQDAKKNIAKNIPSNTTPCKCEYVERVHDQSNGFGPAPALVNNNDNRQQQIELAAHVWLNGQSQTPDHIFKLRISALTTTTTT